MDRIPRNVGLVPSDIVQAIKVRHEWHQLKRRTLNHLVTQCGKYVSYARPICHIDRAMLECTECQQN